MTTKKSIRSSEVGDILTFWWKKETTTEKTCRPWSQTRSRTAVGPDWWDIRNSGTAETGKAYVVGTPATAVMRLTLFDSDASEKESATRRQGRAEIFVAWLSSNLLHTWTVAELALKGGVARSNEASRIDPRSELERPSVMQIEYSSETDNFCFFSV